MEHLHIWSTFWKMLNSIYPLLGIVNCAFGSICVAGTCIIVKFLHPNKISENDSLQDEVIAAFSWCLFETSWGVCACLIGTCTYLHCHSTRILMQGSWIVKSLDSSGGVDAVMPGSADVHDAVEQNVKTLIPSKSSQSGSICAFSYKMCLHF